MINPNHRPDFDNASNNTPANAPTPDPSNVPPKEQGPVPEAPPVQQLHYPPGTHVSPDGKQVWNGHAWEPIGPETPASIPAPVPNPPPVNVPAPVPGTSAPSDVRPAETTRTRTDRPPRR